jgi:hypothetical protein
MHAVTVQQLHGYVADELDDYLPLAGGQMTGAIEMTGANTLSATGSLTVAAGGTVTLGQDGTANLHAVTVGQLNTAIAGTVLHFDDPIVGAGTSASPYTVQPASSAQIVTGTDDEFPISSAGLRTQMGGAATAASLGTTATTVVPAIHELSTRVNALTAAVVLIGTYDLVDVTPGAGSPFGPTPGALPGAAAGNRGWAVILTAAGPGVPPAPPGPLAVGDWLISDGAGWVHIPLHHPATAAANVTVGGTVSTTIGTNVQAALEWLHDNTIGSIFVDPLGSIVGDGLAAATALTVGVVDGGTYT